MSNQYLTPDGFKKETFENLKKTLETGLQNIFGIDLDLDYSGTAGQIVDIFSKIYANEWDLFQELYDANDVTKAANIMLDKLISINNLERLPAVATQVKNVYLTGQDNTLISAGKIIAQNNTEIQCSLDKDVLISKSNAIKTEIEINSVIIGSTYTITIDAVNYDYIAQVGDDKIVILTALKNLIDAGSWGGTTQINNEILSLEGIFIFVIDIIGSLIIKNISSLGNFTAIEKGKISLPANTLNLIITPVFNWESVNNPVAGLTGRGKETDDELRIRNIQTIIKGSASEAAIRSNLISYVEGVNNVLIYSNRENAIDSEGRPPKSFETVVEGGTDLDIANLIWQNMPAGIESWGNTSITITDSQGFDQIINFSRVVNKYIWVEVKRSKYPEEEYPPTGDDLIKEAIVKWSQNRTNIDIGKDIILQRLFIPIYTVPGVGNLELRIAKTDTPAGSPVYTTNNLPIGIRELGNFSIVRITVMDL